ncbi:MAG: hypothetical protein ACK553_12680 [Planctomycetota bacterium]
MVVDEISNHDSVVGGMPTRKSRKGYWAAVLVIGSALVSSTGCTAWTGAQNAWQYNHYWNDSMMGYRQKSMASKAWHNRKHCYANQRYLKEFSRGFKAGYMDVASGGTGCTPAFPPREYWGWKYQSCEGQSRVAAWFSGYPYGAQAAEQDGVGNWTQIQTSKAIQNEYVSHGRMPSDYNGIYPVPPIDPYAQQNVSPRQDLPRSEIIESSLIERTLEPSGAFRVESLSDPAPVPNLQ